MPSSWGKRLEKKLNGLADTASKESIQTHANWIAFNRKHGQTITMVLTKALQDYKSNDKRQWLFWQIINEILVREKENSVKWDRLGELRLALGEALQPAMKALGSSMPEQLKAYIEDWEDRDVFGGPSVNAQIRWIYQHRHNVSAAMTAKAADSNAAKTSDQATIDAGTNSSEPQRQKPSTASVATKSLPDKKAGTSAVDDNDGCIISGTTDTGNDVAVEAREKDQREVQTITTSIQTTAEFDFESKGVPPGRVESKDFLDPCTAITTLQIAREVRTNTAIEISTALEKLPADIQALCEEIDSGKISELDTSTTNDFSIRVPSSLIDLDIDEEASNLNMFQDIVQRQQKAREKLIYLLLRSRCKFGSSEAAQEFYEVDDLAKKLKSRKELLSDALELEGLDRSEIGNDSKMKKRDLDQELPALNWYKQDSNGSTSGEGQRVGSQKKQKVV